jgi:hypothetical protein
VYRWTKAVERMIPVPNCLRTVKMRWSFEFRGSHLWMRIGPKTPRAEVARMTNRRPTRRPTS